MADIHQTISLGIGSPASIPFFLTLGLGIGAQIDTPESVDFVSVTASVPTITAVTARVATITSTVARVPTITGVDVV